MTPETVSTPSQKRVAVIGAGPSGLVTVKELLAEGHLPTCFERGPSTGGVYRFSECDGVVWESCRLTSSGLLMAFSDFPVSPAESEHMTAAEYANYLERFCDAFDISRHIRFDTTVLSVSSHPDGDWVVSSMDAGGAMQEERFDAVAVCSGLNQHPYLPLFDGQNTFTGAILHGSQYRRASQAAGKRVLVVGGGESGADIAAEVSAVAADSVLSLRRGVAVVPRRSHGKPSDYRLARINHSAAHWVAHTRHPGDDWKRRIYHMAFLPFVVYDRLANRLAALRYEVMPLLHPRRVWSGGLAQIRIGLEARRTIGRLLAESGGTVLEQFGTKSDDFVTAIATGHCRRVGSIARFEGSCAWFEDGTSFEPDLVIFCTGFQRKAPFLDDELVNGDRYLHTFNPTVGGSLAFIGFVRPAHGAIPPLSELQARWFAQVVSEKVPLPPRDVMIDSIARTTHLRQRIFRTVRCRLEHLVDYTSFCDELASQIGSKPTLATLRRERFAFRFRFFAGPFVAAQYRLVGPHARPSLARQVIEHLPVTHPLPVLLALYFRWALTRVLSRVLGSEFAPKLQLH